MAGGILFGLLLIAVNVIGQQTGFDCNQRPPFTPDVKNCCKRPAINLGRYKELCYNSTVTSRFGNSGNDNHAFMNPCSVECIYTQAGGLSNGQFNMPNINALLNEIMPNDPVLANVFFTGFQRCGPQTYKMMQEFEEKHKASQNMRFPGLMPQCSPYAVMTTFCAMRYAFINCPSDLWTSSEICNKAQNYVKNCEPMAFGGPKRRNRI